MTTRLGRKFMFDELMIFYLLVLFVYYIYLCIQASVNNSDYYSQSIFQRNLIVLIIFDSIEL